MAKKKKEKKPSVQVLLKAAAIRIAELEAKLELGKENAQMVRLALWGDRGAYNQSPEEIVGEIKRLQGKLEGLVGVEGRDYSAPFREALRLKEDENQKLWHMVRTLTNDNTLHPIRNMPTEILNKMVEKTGMIPDYQPPFNKENRYYDSAKVFVRGNCGCGGNCARCRMDGRF